MKLRIVLPLLALLLTAGVAPAAAQTGPSAADACYTWGRTLSEGTSGEDVRQLQIRVAGYPGYGGVLGLDGQFGPATKAAVTRFQQAYGLGADGILRVARAGALVERGVLAELPDGTGADDWFMDYRNGDGSIAEMCGNGVRVFAHYLCAQGLESRTDFVVGSRAGGKPVQVHAAGPVDGEVTVDMGVVRELGESAATVEGRVYKGLGIDPATKVRDNLSRPIEIAEGKPLKGLV